MDHCFRAGAYFACLIKVFLLKITHALFDQVSEFKKAIENPSKGRKNEFRARVGK